MDFRGHISTFRAENTPKSGSFKAQNDAQIASEQLQTIFQKVQKTGFLTLKMVKMTLSPRLIVDFLEYSDIFSTFRPLNRGKNLFDLWTFRHLNLGSNCRFYHGIY